MSRGSSSTGGNYRGVSWWFRACNVCFFHPGIIGIRGEVNEWLWASRLSHGKDPSWVIKYTQSQSSRPRTKPEALQQERESGSRDKMWQNKVFKCFSLSSRGDVVRTANMTPPRGDWMCTRAYGGQACRQGGFPPGKEGVGFTVWWWTVKHLSFTLVLFADGSWKQKNKRPGWDGSASCSFFNNNDRRCLFSFRINYEDTLLNRFVNWWSNRSLNSKLAAPEKGLIAVYCGSLNVKPFIILCMICSIILGPLRLFSYVPERSFCCFWKWEVQNT